MKKLLVILMLAAACSEGRETNDPPAFLFTPDVQRIDPNPGGGWRVKGADGKTTTWRRAPFGWTSGAAQTVHVLSDGTYMLPGGNALRKTNGGYWDNFGNRIDIRDAGCRVVSHINTWRRSYPDRWEKYR